MSTFLFLLLVAAVLVVGEFAAVLDACPSSWAW